MSSTKNIFAVYASQDKDVLQYLLAHLQPLEKDFNIAIWSDDYIDRGQTWTPRNISLLDHVDVFVLLLSNSFMQSEFIKQDEFKMVIARYKEGKAIVIPIILDDCPWDVQFTFDDYTFNFRELLVFHKDEKRIADWSPTDQVFTQVAYYVRGLLTSSSKKKALEEPVINGGKKIRNTKKEEQIAIDFFEEREANINAEWERKLNKEAETKKRVEENNRLREEAEAKEGIRKAKRLRQKAEIQKRIEKEKTLKEKAKKDRKIDEDVEAKRIVQEGIRNNEVARTKPEVEEKRQGETTKSQGETGLEKGPKEIVAAQRRTTKKNSLARYNYQFKTVKTVQAKRVVQEGIRDKEVTKTKPEVEEKRQGETTKSQGETELEKGPREILTAEKRTTKEDSLARYNYQFKTVKTVEAKKAVLEERRGNEEAKAKTAVANKRRGELANPPRDTEREKRVGEIILALKGVLKRNRSSLQNFQVKSATAIKQFFQEAKAKVAVDEIRSWEIVAVLKRVLKRNRFVIRNFQVKSAKAINQFLKEAKKNINTNKKRKVRSEFLIAALALFGILIFVFTGDSEKQSTRISEIEQAEVDSDAGANTKTNQENQAAAILTLGIGDIYKGGIVFAIDPSNKTGKIAYMNDEGPMTWNNAMTIHEQLGEGWRLPTLDELRLMYNTIGQGADNIGEFADELYWSATPFDDYQARLLRFSDGNASYHFNSVGTYRKFRVRAIRDFKR